VRKKSIKNFQPFVKKPEKISDNLGGIFWLTLYMSIYRGGFLRNHRWQLWYCLWLILTECVVLCASVAVQRYRGTVQLPSVGHILVDARRRSLSSYNHRLCIQRVTDSLSPLHHHRMG